MNEHERLLDMSAWAWARGSADVLSSLVRHGLLHPLIAARFAQAWADALNAELQERGIPPVDRLEALTHFDHLIHPQETQR